MPVVDIGSAKDVDALAHSLNASAQSAAKSFRDILAKETDGMQILRLMKFTKIGRHPTEDRALNIIEQINQTFT